MIRPEDAGSEAARLRLAPPPPMRLSRRVVTGVVLGAGVLAAGVVGVGLARRPVGPAVVSKPAVGHATPAEGLSALPKDYAAPKLGPPLPGDLGRPMLEAGLAEPAPPIASHPETISPARQAAPNSGGIFFDRRAKAAPMSGGGKLLAAGAIIPAALVTGLDAELPGPAIAQVTEPVFDTATGAHLLIPRGARLIGEYDQAASFGQGRVGVVWKRLILPDGTGVVLSDLPGADAQGRAGLKDGVDRHWGRFVGASLVSTALAIGSEATLSGEGRLGRALARASSGTANGVGEALVGRQLDVKPGLSARPGLRLRVLVTRDLLLESHGEAS